MKSSILKPLIIFAALTVLALGAPAADGQAVQTVGSGQVNWTAGTIEATGMGICPKEDAATNAERKLMAMRAATADGYRNLVEVVKGVRVTAEASVSDLAAGSGMVSAKVDAFVYGAQRIAEKYENDELGGVICTVTLRAPLDGKGGFGRIILPHVKPLVIDKSKPKEVATLVLTEATAKKLKVEETLVNYVRPKPRALTKLTTSALEQARATLLTTQTLESIATDPVKIIWTGIVIDTQGTGYAWNMFPRIVSEDGRTIFDISVIEKWPEEISFTPFELNIEKGKAHPRVKKIPLFVNAEKIDGVVVYISKKEADKIIALNNKYQLLSNGRILFVIK